MLLTIIIVLVLNFGTFRTEYVDPHDVRLLNMIESHILLNLALKLKLNEFLIFPGTKWCGAGNIADYKDDLGEFAETDKCCRAHDMCSDRILAFDSNHNLTNDHLFTRMSCECDDTLHNCLKDVNTMESNAIGMLYSYVFQKQCFKLEYPIITCEEHFHPLLKRCKKYKLDESGQKKYQWFDVPLYSLFK